jgi:8-oxo-dGTP diphosphatase
MKLTLVVACALVDADRRVLIAQRPEGKPMAGLWEFPGGKVEPGERPEATLIRE